MNRCQPQITQYFNRPWEGFLPHFNPLWELRTCIRWLVGSPSAHVAEGYLVQTCFFHVLARAEGTTVPFISQSWSVCNSCPPMHSSPPVFPIACSPNGPKFSTKSFPKEARTWLSVMSQALDSVLSRGPGYFTGVRS